MVYYFLRINHSSPYIEKIQKNSRNEFNLQKKRVHVTFPIQVRDEL